MILGEKKKKKVWLLGEKKSLYNPTSIENTKKCK